MAIQSSRPQLGFFRSLASPVYAIGRLFSAFERAANVIDMHAEKLEAQTEVELTPQLEQLQAARAKLQNLGVTITQQP